MNTRAFGIRLQYADAAARALVVNALHEKAGNDREAANAINTEDKPNRADDSSADALARLLRDQADFAELIADELGGE